MPEILGRRWTQHILSRLNSNQAMRFTELKRAMPGISGTQLARALRRRRADLPIVLVSGYTGPMLSERALAAGVTEILKKPVQSRDIASALARVLRRAA